MFYCARWGGSVRKWNRRRRRFIPIARRLLQVATKLLKMMSIIAHQLPRVFSSRNAQEINSACSHWHCMRSIVAKLQSHHRAKKEEKGAKRRYYYVFKFVADMLCISFLVYGCVPISKDTQASTSFYLSTCSGFLQHILSDDERTRP